MGKLADLKGKKVGTARGGAQELLLYAELAKAGLTWSDQSGKDVRIMFLAYADLNQALRSAQLDAISRSEPQSSQAIRQGYAVELVKPYDTPLGEPVRAEDAEGDGARQARPAAGSEARARREIAFIPLAILWFGLGNPPAFFLISLGAFFPVLMNTIAGVRTVDAIYVRAAQNLGAPARTLFWRVLFPAAMPSVLSGLRVGVGGSSMPEVALQIRSVRKEFGGIVPLDRIDLDIAAGEFVCLLGPSGCGKSTLLNAIAGFTQPSSGEILAFGKPVGKPELARAMMFQEYALFPWMTVRENVSFGLQIRGDRGARKGRRAAGQAGAARIRRPLSEGPLRRNAAKGRPRPRAGARRADVADGRAFRRPRRADARCRTSCFASGPS